MRRVLFLLLACPLLLTGCIGDLIGWGCFFTDDEEHCYQAAAVQNEEPEDCEKVITERFEHSNPPRDKCYLMIAENTGDPSVCDEIVGGPASYTREGCLNSVLSSHHPNECSEASDEVVCRSVYATHGHGCGDGFEFVSGVCDPISYEEEDTEEEATVDGTTMTTHLSNAEKAEIDSFATAAAGKYMDALEADIESSGGSRKAGLEAYRDFLNEGSDAFGEAKTAYEDLMEVKKIFLDAYDPANDIAHFDVEAELGSGFTDQVWERLFGADDPPTGLARDNAQSENALIIYGKMLEQQADNDFMQQDLSGRLGSIVSSRVQGELTDKVKEQAIDIAKAGAGTAFGAVTAVGDALQAFQDEAQHQMFLGLARAYNRRRDALEQSMPNASPQEIHERTVREVKQNPYADNTDRGFVKHGNILENPDCRDSSNPLCIDDRVWWTAMDKTYRFNNK